jgi:hypothetical protein
VTLLEILVIVSATLQVGITIFGLYIFYHLTGKKRQIWLWFVIPLGLIIIRRILAVSRYSSDWPTLEIEYALTIGATLCWAIYMFGVLKDKISNGK